MARYTYNSCDSWRCRLQHIVMRSDLLTTRFTIAVSSLVFSVLLWWPGTLFVPTRTTYRLMSQVMDENTWGALFFLHFIVASYSLLSNRRCLAMFFADAMLGAVLWTFATVMCFASHWQVGVTYAPPAAMSAEVGVLLASWWYVIRWLGRR